MRAQRFRNLAGGLVDRSELIEFTFDGRPCFGYRGDTLASALLAHGERRFARSFKYHRPRGVMAAGAEEPNALVTVGEGAHAEPNLKATEVEIEPGMAARSQNRWPSLAFDLGAAAGLVSALLPAGFYYKTFMWPPRGWLFYERFIRRAAGLGRGPELADPDRYERAHAFCDVLVVGGGPAGIAAAAAAAETGARTVLVEDSPALGGSLRGERRFAGGRPLIEWIGELERRLRADPRVTVLTRATAFGYYDGNLVAVAERCAAPAPASARQRLHLVRAREVVLATGAHERPIVFPGNDRPGVMLASAARTYANRYAVRVATRAVVFAAHDSACAAAADVARAGVEVAAVVDARPGGPAPEWRAVLDALGIECLPGHVVAKTRGSGRVRGVVVRRLERGGEGEGGGERLAGPARRIACDAVLVAGGWSPAVHLVAQSQGRLAWRDDLGAFVPAESGRPRQRWAGALTGELPLAAAWESGRRAGADAAHALGIGREDRDGPPDRDGYGGAAVLPPLDPDPDGGPEPCGAPSAAAPEPLWAVPGPGTKAFVDFQNDVTAADVELAVRESYASVEHLKRYTTLGMGTDQGRTSNINGLALLARARGAPVPDVGHTTYRPPFAPVTLGLLAGPETGPRLAPVRETPMHDWHAAALAGVERGLRPAGLWLRPHSYPRAGESASAAALREARHVREAVGIVDISTLGKIELDGPDAAEFLERVYVNRWRSLPAGRSRYGLMLREDGHVLDDGTATRLSERRFYMTTTTAEAAHVLRHLEFHAQTVWPELAVRMVDVTDQWAAMALAGPRSREVLAAAVDGAGGGNGGAAGGGDARARIESLAWMGCLETGIAGAPARVLRVTFSGELGYEVHVPADWGLAVWERLLECGAPFGIAPYGTEAMGILRIEKGHVAGPEIDGRTTPHDLGLERMLRPGGGYVGHWGLGRPALAAPGRKRLVGLKSKTGAPIPPGAQLIDQRQAVRFERGDAALTSLGHVTSAASSPAVGAEIALALVRGGRERLGETLIGASPVTGESVPVLVCDPVFFDPEGARARA